MPLDRDVLVRGALVHTITEFHTARVTKVRDLQREVVGDQDIACCQVTMDKLPARKTREHAACIAVQLMIICRRVLATAKSL